MAWSALLAQSRRPVFLCLVLLALVCGAGLHRVRVDDRLRDLFRTESSEYELLARVEERFGADDNDVLLLVESSGHLISRDGVAGLRAVVDRLRDSAVIDKVHSLLDARGARRVGRYILPLVPPPESSDERFAQAQQEADHHPLVQGNILSPDGKTTVVIAKLRGEAPSMAELTLRLDRLKHSLQSIATEHQLTIGVTGIPALRSDMTAQLAQSQWKFALATLVLSSLAAMAFYRSWASLLISGIGPVLGLVCTMGVLGWLGIPITPITSIVPPLVFVVGMTDSVHLLFHIQGELRNGCSRREAAARTIHEMWKPCGLTSLTTTVGFATLMLTPMEAVRTFGLACAIGAGMNFVTVMLCAPLLATTFLGKHLSQHAPGAKLADFMANLVQRRYRGLVVGGIGLTLAMLPCWFMLTPDNRAGEFLPYQSDAAAVLRTAESRLGGALQAQVLVQWPEGAEASQIVPALEKVESAMNSLRHAAPAISLASVLRSLPTENGSLDEQLEVFADLPEEATRNLLHAESGSTLVRASMKDRGAAASEAGFAAVESQLRELERQYPGWTFELTGTTVVSYRTANRMIQELASSLLLAGGMIFLCLLALLRSVRLGLVAILPNLFPLAATAAALALTTGVIQYTAVMALTIGIALAVDDTIQFMTRFQYEQRRGASPNAAADRALRQVGAVLIVSSVIMLCGFSSLLWCSLPPIRLFGALSCVLILAALAGDALLLPAMVRQFCGESQPAGAAQQLPTAPLAETATVLADSFRMRSRNGQARSTANP